MNHVSASGSYCLDRTRQRLVYILLGLLLLAIALCMGVYGISLLGEDKSYWGYTEYIKLVVSFLLFIGLAAAGIYEGVTAVRDACFPEKSMLAQSIRSQLPYPDGAPGWRELFAMVDQDIAENGQWFGKVAVGREWVLGDQASYIPRIRAVFRQNELKATHTQNGSRTRRAVRLLIVDDRKQAQITTLQDPRELDDIISCLRLRTPAAHFGNYNEYIGYCNKTDMEWYTLERDFQKRRENLQADSLSESPRSSGSSQDFVLIDTLGLRSSQVSQETVLTQIENARPGTSFELELLSLLPAGDWGFLCKIRWAALKDSVVLVAYMAFSADRRYELRRTMDQTQARDILLALLKDRSLPDFSAWEIFQEASGETAEQKEARRLILTDSSGTRRQYDSFSRRDVELAAEGLSNGKYTAVSFLRNAICIFITVEKGSLIAEASNVEPSGLQWYQSPCDEWQASQWLLALYDGNFAPDFSRWKNITRKVEKALEKRNKNG